jgi:hypothetical protein
MRGFRLNGWQRIGIVLSVVWAMVAGTFAWKHAHDQADAVPGAMGVILKR